MEKIKSWVVGASCIFLPFPLFEFGFVHQEAKGQGLKSKEDMKNLLNSLSSISAEISRNGAANCYLMVKSQQSPKRQAFAPFSGLFWTGSGNKHYLQPLQLIICVFFVTMKKNISGMMMVYTLVFVEEVGIYMRKLFVSTLWKVVLNFSPF